jgi:MraZ protein
MNFVGHFEYNLDAKGRLMIPARFRRVIAPDAVDVLVLSKGKERCLNLYPLPEWNDVILKELHSLPPGPQKRNLVRYYSDKSIHVNLDKAGLVAIPAHFLSMIGDPKKVIVIGALTYIEIWAPEDYEQIRNEALDTYNRGDWEY